MDAKWQGLQAHLLERAGDTAAALKLLCGQLQAAAQALLEAIMAGLVPVEQLQPSLHFRAFMQAKGPDAGFCTGIYRGGPVWSSPSVTEYCTEVDDQAFRREL